MTRGHEIRECYQCGTELKVYNSDAAHGAGKYCSTRCADLGRSWIPQLMAMLPCTGAQAAAALGIDQHPAGQAIRRLCNKGMAHACSIVDAENVRRGQPAKALLFAAGPQPDPAVPLNHRSATTYFTDLAILAAMPGTYSELVERTGLTQTTIVKRMAAMREEVDEKGLRVKSFIRSYKRTLGGAPGPFIAVHARGPGKDQPCKLKPRTQRQKYERWRDKVERTGKKEALYEKRKAVRDQKALLISGDPLLNAFFGAPMERMKKERDMLADKAVPA